MLRSRSPRVHKLPAIPKAGLPFRGRLLLVRVFIRNSKFPAYTKTEVPRETSVLERKKEPMNVELSRLFHKPGKRNAVGFF